MNKKKFNKKGEIAIAQILILIIGIIAIAYAAGGQIGFVSAVAGDCSKEGGTCVINDGAHTCSTGFETNKCAGADNVQCCKETYSPKESSTTPQIPMPTIPTTYEGPDFSEYSYEDYSKYITDSDGDGYYDMNYKGMRGDKNLGEKFVDDLMVAIPTTGVALAMEEGGKRIFFKEVAEEGGKTTRIPGQEMQPSSTATESTWIKDFLASKALHTVVVAWASYFLVKWATSYGSERNADVVNTAALWTAGIISIYALLHVVGTPLIASGPIGWAIGLIVLGVAAITAIFSWQVYSKEAMFYQVSAWQPPDGGRWCELCNDFPTGCSEYQCRTFGKGCSLINENTEYEECIWEFQDDRIPPVLSPLRGILEGGLTYEEFNITSPPERGVRIIDSSNDDNCVGAFTSLTFGLKSDENAICRWDYERRESFDLMSFSMDEGSPATINHTLFIPNSATASSESLANVGISIEEERTYGFFVKCKDIHGNENPLHFLAEFCVESGPDLDAPEISGTNYMQGSYIKFNASSLPLQIYTNEPADCKWDHDNLEYDNMNYNMTSCSQNTENYLFGFSYGCVGNLSGFQDRQENRFYIRCKDKPWWNEGDEGRRFENRESYTLILAGTQPLVIDALTVNGEESGVTIKGTSDEVKAAIEVTTAAGADNGRAKCSYLSGGTYYSFYNDGNTDYTMPNKQRLWLVPGNYSYNISCSDAAGNSVQDVIQFALEKDETGVTVVRAFKESNNLKIITDEEATCVYDTVSCLYDFENGLAMQSYDNINHFTSWDSDTTFYIKCQDEYGNLPPQDRCSIEVRPFDI